MVVFHLAMIHRPWFEFAIIRTCNDVKLNGQDCSKYLFLINNPFMVDFDLILVRHQILNLSRFWEVTFVCFQGSLEEMVYAIGTVLPVECPKSLISFIGALHRHGWWRVISLFWHQGKWLLDIIEQNLIIMLTLLLFY